MNGKEISAAIISGNLSNDELTVIAQAIKFARAQLAKQTKHTLARGALVKFRGGAGQIEVGTLIRIAIKYASVRVGTVNWKVPVYMLEPA